MKLLQILFVLVLCHYVATNYLSDNYKYLIKQRTDRSNGSFYLYSPYILWNTDIYNSSQLLTSPLKLTSVNGQLDIKLTIQAFRVVTELFSFNTRAYCYNDQCSIPGPSIYCSPGDNIKITITNLLEDSPGKSDNKSGRGFIYQYPNRTNIYFHGLHLDPSVNSPYLYTSGGGDSLVYDFVIDSDSAPGLNWYQSRVHGYSALQCMGGLFGALVVLPHTVTSDKPADIPESITAMQRSVLVFSHIMLDKSTQFIPGVIGNTYSDADDDYATSALSYIYLSAEFGSTLPVSATYYPVHNSTLTDAWLTNGQYQPTLTLQPGEWHILDMLVASGDRIVEVEVKPYMANANIWNDDFSCDVRLLSLDGTYLTVTRTGLFVKHLTLTQAARASVAIQCNSTGKYYLQSTTTFNQSSPYYGIGDFQTKSIQNLLIIEVNGSFVDYMSPPPMDLSSIQRPAMYDATFATTNSSTSQSLSMSTAQMDCCGDRNSSEVCSSGSESLFWLGMGSDCRLPCYSNILCESLFSPASAAVELFPTVRNGQCRYSSFIGAADGDNCAVTNTSLKASLDVDNLVDVWGYSDSLIPVHIQSTRLQFLALQDVSASTSNILKRDLFTEIDSNANSSNFGEPGDWRDSWPVLVGGNSFRTVFKEFSGDYLIMSHFLKFEDLGFIGAVNVTASSEGSIQRTNRSITSVDDASDIEDAGIVPPEIYVHIPSSALANYSCDVAGLSWHYNETISSLSAAGELPLRHMSVNSCPNHFAVCQSGECGGQPGVSRALIRRQLVSVPLYPVLSALPPRDVSCSSELVGVALNGVGIYSSFDSSRPPTCHAVEDLPIRPSSDFSAAAVGRTACTRPGRLDGLLYCGNVIEKMASKMDMCGGVADDEGTYKYLVAPTCLLQQLSPSGDARSANLQLGWAMDGFPIYGPVGPRGVAMLPCGTASAHRQLCLDVCGGFYGQLPGYDNFTYRYYMAGPIGNGACSAEVRSLNAQGIAESYRNCSRLESKCCVSDVPSKDFWPYSIGCLRGCTAAELSLPNGCSKSQRKGYTAQYIPEKVNDKLKGVFNSTKAPNGTVSGLSNEITSTASINVSVAGNADRLFLFRNPFDQTFSIYNVSSQSVSSEPILSSRNDAFIRGLVRDGANKRVFFATQKSIFSFDEVTKEYSVLIEGLLRVTIVGFNLGASIDEVISITVGGETCTSVVHLSASLVQCLCVKEVSVSSQVRLLTVGGAAVGVSPDPQADKWVDSGLPIIQAIYLDPEPFSPFAIEYHAGTLYWSNVAEGAFSIQRSKADGSRVETVVGNVQRCLALSVSADTTQRDRDLLVFADGDCGVLAKIYLPTLSAAESNNRLFVSLAPLSSSVVVLSQRRLAQRLQGSQGSGGFCTYSSNFIAQENLDLQQSSLCDETPQVVFQGLITPQALALDSSAGMLFLTLQEGVVLKIDMNYIRNFSSSSQSLYRLDLSGWLRNGSASRNALTYWMSAVTVMPSTARLDVLCVLSVTNSSSDSWRQQRILFVDTNQQKLFATTESGYPISFIDLSAKLSIYVPHSLSCFYSSNDPDTVDVYLSEFFGE